MKLQMEDDAVSQPSKRSKPPDQISVPTLPQELISEILLKLPVEPLCKFRSVSKSWLSLICSPDFVKAHLTLSASDKDYTHHRVIYSAEASTPDLKDCSLYSLLCNSVTESFDLDYPEKEFEGFPHIMGSFNGLICLTIGPHDLLPDYYLWNPSTRKYNELPDPTHDMRRCHDDEDQPVEYTSGFAYDEFQDDYKVVSICTIYSSGYRHSCHVRAKIYSLKSNSWRRINGVQRTELLEGPGKLVDRKLHWLDFHRDIISIDLVDEKWEELELPSCFKGRYGLVLGGVGSDLTVSFDNGQDSTYVWVMKEYGVKESWTKMLTIKSCSSGSVFSSPIFTSNEGEILLGHGARFMKYNPKDGSIRYLDVPDSLLWFEAEIYVKSLVSPFPPKRPRMKRQQQKLK